MRNWKMLFGFLCIGLLLAGLAPTAVAQQDNRQIGINVVLRIPVNPAVLASLGGYGRIRDVIPAIRAVTLQARASQLAAIRALPYVAAANPDAVRNGAPVDTVAAEDFMDGLSTWDLDAINVTDFGFDNRQVVLTTALASTWPCSTLAWLTPGGSTSRRNGSPSQYAKSFGGGGGEMGNVSEQPNKWEHDQNSHGTHVTSTILGYSLGGTPINGVAPHGDRDPGQGAEPEWFGGPRSLPGASPTSPT